MSFFKNLKSKLLGSIKEDLNSALGSRRVSFNSKISGALDDLIAMKTGINISNVPQNISEEALLSAEDRKKAEKNIDEIAAKDFGRNTPKKTDILRFPTGDQRFVDNWIIFRTVRRSFDDGMRGAIPKDPKTNKEFFMKTDYGQDADGMGKEYTIAMYFPTGVKDTVSVDYEAKDVGLSDIALDKLIQGEIGELFSMGDDAIGETLSKARQAAVAFSAFEKGVVIDNPKFNTFSGVGFRDHSYSFTLNPYNETDAEEITKIIHAFKMMMLPMTTEADRRTMLMPAEWTIDFQGPILGHIEHPQNCFLKSCDVDYSGGKDMSFIESFTQSKAAIPPEQDADGNDIKGSGEPAIQEAVQHYPNGINLTLTFQEILNIDRLRYVQRVAASAMGAQQDTQKELDNFEKQIENHVDVLATESFNDAKNIGFASKQEAKDWLAKNPTIATNHRVVYKSFGQGNRNKNNYYIEHDGTV